MSTLGAVVNIFVTAVYQVVQTVAAHGLTATALAHLRNIAGATVGWLASGITGIATLVTTSIAGVAAIATKGAEGVKYIFNFFDYIFNFFDYIFNFFGNIFNFFGNIFNFFK